MTEGMNCSMTEVMCKLWGSKWKHDKKSQIN